jgi:hypothetical protein
LDSVCANGIPTVKTALYGEGEIVEKRRCDPGRGASRNMRKKIE